MLLFENAYLERHRAFVLEHLRGADRDGRVFAAERLQRVVHRDPEVRAALVAAGEDVDDQVRAAIERALGLATNAQGDRRPAAESPLVDRSSSEDDDRPAGVDN
jgi:hypothetical protein